LRTESLRAIKQFRDKETGDLVVGGSNIPGQYILPALLGKFRERFPRINIRLLIGDSKNITEHLLEGSIEIGLIGAKVVHRHVCCQPLIKDELICIAPTVGVFSGQKKLKLKEISQLPFIFREKGSGTRTAVEEALKKLHLDLNDLKVVAEIGSNEAVRQAVKAGMGVSIISRLAVLEDLEQGRFKEIRINRLPMVRNFFIITLKQRPLSPLALDFKEFLLKAV